MLIGLSIALIGCGGESASLRPFSESLLAALPEPVVSDLLAQARAGLTDGTISPAMRAALAASPHAADQQAARVLAALDAPAALAEEPPESPGDLEDAPRIKMGTAPPEATPTAVRTSTAKSTKSAPVATPPPAKPRARLERVGLSSTKKGASLSLRGSGGLVVGVASQPTSGIVRLVMDAEASMGVLRSRPRITGARVTGVRRTGKTVFVTLTLDPGWSLRGIVRTRSGARVDLTAPA